MLTQSRAILFVLLIGSLTATVSGHWKHKGSKLNDNLMRSDCPFGTRPVPVPGALFRCEPVFPAGHVTPFRLSNVVFPPQVFRHNPVVGHGWKGLNKPFSSVKSVKSALHSSLTSKFAGHGFSKHGHKSKF